MDSFVCVYIVMAAFAVFLISTLLILGKQKHEGATRHTLHATPPVGRGFLAFPARFFFRKSFCTLS